MTLPVLAKEDQVAELVKQRDWMDSEAFYYRRRAADQHDRQHAIDLELWVRALDEVIGNLRRELAAVRDAVG